MGVGDKVTHPTAQERKHVNAFPNTISISQRNAASVSSTALIVSELALGRVILYS